MHMNRQKKWMIYVLVLLCIRCGLPAEAAIPETVLPGGMAFGVRFACEGLVVVGFTEVTTENGSCMPAYDAGLRIGDRIFAVNDTKVSTGEEFVEKIENSGHTVEIRYERDGKECTTRFQPVYSTAEGKYKTGMWIRDTTAGIGTVTFLLPETGAFAGLGHGICDQNTGELLPMGRGTVVDVTISGVSKGVSGRPGELMGYFTENRSGVLLGNTPSGVYGILQNIPYDKVPEEQMQLGRTEEIHDGEAYIWCTLDGGWAEKYSICISRPRQGEGGNFEITVTDPALIEKTGGIVQGMSGSPIIQDGKLIGAVTHVLISDPTRGYGIPIENMLAEMPELMK